MAGGSGVTLFRLGDHLDWLSLTLCMIGLIVFTIIFEVFLHNLEHRVTNPAVTKMLSKVYKELMILGFISFVLLMIRQFMDLPLTQLLMFELSHVWIFSVAVFFVIHAILFMLLVRKVKRHWDATAHMQVTNLLQKYHATSFWNLPKLWFDVFGRGSVREEMGFHIAKSLFLRVHNLPKNFDFAKYLRRSLTQHITDQLDVKESTWLVVIAVMVINMMRLSATGSLESEDPYANVALGWIIFIVDALLLIASRRSKNRLLMKAGCADMASLPKALMLTQMADQFKTNSQRRLSTTGRRATIRTVHIPRTSPSHLDLASVYPFNKPSIFTKTLEVLMLLQCYSLGLLTLLTGKALLTGTKRWSGVAVLAAAVLPQMLVMLVVSPRILKNHIFVHSITHINPVLVEEVMDIMEVTFLLRTELALVCYAHRVPTMPHGDASSTNHLAHAERLFGEIDTSDNGTVGMNELRAFLNRVGLHHTPRQFRQLVRSIDHDQSKQLTLQEFSVVVEHGAECVHNYRESLHQLGRDDERITLGDVFEYVVEQAGYKLRSGFDTFAAQVIRYGTPPPTSVGRVSSVSRSLARRARDTASGATGMAGAHTTTAAPMSSMQPPPPPPPPPPAPHVAQAAAHVASVTTNPFGVPSSPLLRPRSHRRRRSDTGAGVQAGRQVRQAQPSSPTPSLPRPASVSTTLSSDGDSKNQPEHHPAPARSVAASVPLTAATATPTIAAPATAAPATPVALATATTATTTTATPLTNQADVPSPAFVPSPVPTTTSLSPDVAASARSRALRGTAQSYANLRSAQKQVKLKLKLLSSTPRRRSGKSRASDTPSTPRTRTLTKSVSLGGSALQVQLRQLSSPPAPSVPKSEPPPPSPSPPAPAAPVSSSTPEPAPAPAPAPPPASAPASASTTQPAAGST